MQACDMKLVAEGKYAGVQLHSPCQLHHSANSECALNQAPGMRHTGIRRRYKLGVSAGIIAQGDIAAWNGRFRDVQEGKYLVDATTGRFTLSPNSKTPSF